MKKVFTIGLIIPVLLCIAQSNEDLLTKAYAKKSNALLLDFFKKWNNEIQPIQNAELAKCNDTVQHAYKIFASLYNTTTLDSMVGDVKNSFHKKAFLVVQNEIETYFTEKIHYTDKEIEDSIVKYITNTEKNEANRSKMLAKTDDGKLKNHLLLLDIFGLEIFTYKPRLKYKPIQNFRPTLDSFEKKTLYLNSKYDSVLQLFLGSKYNRKEKGIAYSYNSRRDILLRKKFLEKYINIGQDQSGKQLKLFTAPLATIIVFDKYMQYARVEFTLLYGTGNATFHRVENNWRIESAKLDWQF
jgi:hypothetical protein